MEKEKKRKLKAPNTFVLLMCLILFAAILTYIVPAGIYDRTEVDGRQVIVADSFHYVDQTPVSLMGLLSGLSGGMMEGAAIIFFVFIVGGAINVVQDTGAIEGGLIRLAKVLKGKEVLVVPAIMLAVSASSAIAGLSEEVMPLVPVMVSLAVAMGYDSMVGCAMIIASTGAGFAGAVMNPFTVGVSQSIAGLPALSGMGFRIALYCVMMAVTITIVCRYANKVKKNPQLSPMYEFDKTREQLGNEEDVPFGVREKLVLLVFLASLVLLVYGVLKLGWYFTEIGALFLGMSIVVAIIARMGFNGYGESLTAGMANISIGALYVGVATGIMVVLTEGQVIDTILHAMATLLQNLPSQISAVGMYILQCLLNFIVPSGSGQAAVTMPIMAPLGDLLGVSRQTATICFQLGDGISNAFIPTGGVLMASLALGKVPYGKWVKFYIPLMIGQYAVGLVFVIAAQAMNLGPF